MDKAFREQIIDVYKLLVARSDITAALNACDLMLNHVKDFFDDYKHGLYDPFLNSIIIWAKCHNAKYYKDLRQFI